MFKFFISVEAIRQEKEIKERQIEKEEVKVSPYAADTNLYTRKARGSISKILRLDKQLQQRGRL